MLGARKLTGRRFTQGEYVNGDWVDGTWSEVKLRGAIQPLTDRDTQQLPEAWRTRALFKIYTRTRLRTVNVYGETSGDRINWDGQELLVLGESNQFDTPRGLKLRHYRYSLVEQEIDEETD
jgi:hypothetical protein